MVLYQTLHRILISIQRYGMKSKKKDKKTAILILDNIKIAEVDLVKMVG